MQGKLKVVPRLSSGLSPLRIGVSNRLLHSSALAPPRTVTGVCDHDRFIHGLDARLSS